MNGMKTGISKSELKQARKAEGMRLLENNMSMSEVARRLGVTRQAVFLWKTTDCSEGKPLGRREKLNSQQKDALQRSLLKGAKSAGFSSDNWNIDRIRSLINREFPGVTYSYDGTRELMRSMGFILTWAKPHKDDR